jgi:hypothetical protein
MIGAKLLLSASEHIYYELAFLQNFNVWWHWPLAVFLAGLILAVVWWLYVRDTRELSRGVAGSLWVLRGFAIVGLILFLLEPEKRREQSVIKPSRAVLLVDNSLSMALADVALADGKPLRRIDQVTSLIEATPLLDRLRTDHDLRIYAFADEEKPIPLAMLPKKLKGENVPDVIGNSPDDTTSSGYFRWGLGLLGGAVICLILSALPGLAPFDPHRFLALVATLIGLHGAVLCGMSFLFQPETYPWRSWLEQPDVPVPAESIAESSGGTVGGTNLVETKPEEWKTSLTANGSATRLSDAIISILEQEDGVLLAGIGILTDGNQNQGLPIQDAITAAREAGVRLFPIGIGSDASPRNVRVVDFQAPARIYPGDGFTLQGFVQGSGMSEETMNVQLWVRPADAAAGKSETLVDQHSHKIKRDGEVSSIDFQLNSSDAGKSVYTLKVLSEGEDQDPNDNAKSVTVQVMERKSRVLLIAGGPTREYQFLRVLCFRDKDVDVDVWLQTSTENAAQDADRVLGEFPETLEELMEYDCLVAFDPDWSELSDEQLENLERWVADGAGGMLVIAGSVHTPQWSTLLRERRNMEIIKGLYPVDFFRRGFQLGKDISGSSPIPLALTDEGTKASFLQVGNDAATSLQAWNRFTGIFGPYPSQGPKPGAIVYATAATSGGVSEPLTYFAGHFYGGGRVFYMASGEMWRLRAQDETYFDQFYTRLLRHLGEGRLLRDSNRGILMVDRDRCLIGETVTVRTSLTDRQFRPLTDKNINAFLVTPSGERRPLPLIPVADTIRGGSYAGQFVAHVEGDYVVEVPIPESDLAETMRRQVRARVPNLEAERPQRNNALLSELATRTSGKYFSTLDAIIGTDGASAWADAMPSQDQETLIPLSPDRSFKERLMTTLMAWIVGALSIEWLSRRLSRLA